MNTNLFLSKSLLTLLGVAITISAAPLSLAQMYQNNENREIIKENREMIKDQRQEMQQERISQRCDLISSRVAGREKYLENSIPRFEQTTSKIRAKIQEQISILESQGKETTQIENNLVTFESNSQKILSEKQRLLSQLQGLNPANCDANRASFTNSLKEFNTSFRSHVKSQNDLRSFVRENLISPIKALK